MIESPTSAFPKTLHDVSNPLQLLVDRVATSDQVAFRFLYAFLAAQVWHAAATALPDQTHVPAVTRSTFLELWHTSRNHSYRDGTDVRDWISAIMARQLDDRLRTLASPNAFFGEYDRHVRRELEAVLGTGRAVIRLGPGTFVTVDNLALALSVIAAA
jgi:hypothetical protein